MRLTHPRAAGLSDDQTGAYGSTLERTGTPVAIRPRPPSHLPTSFGPVSTPEQAGCERAVVRLLPACWCLIDGLFAASVQQIRWGRTGAAKTAPRPSLMKLFKLLSQG